VVLFGILWLNISSDIPLLLKLAELPFSEAAPIVSQLAIKILWWIALVLLLLAIIDVVYQKWQHKRDMRMSKQDIKDETKSSDGDPEIKARIRRAMREISSRRMMEEVPKADVVITNPTHFAVALRYTRKEMAAPTVVAKGSDEVAFRIRELGQRKRRPDHGRPSAGTRPAPKRATRRGDSPSLLRSRGHGAGPRPSHEAGGALI
jgi:flagellar biosynthetic protein FlhB